MLGRLFTAASHGRTPSSLESATEEEHTRRLLFPESSPSSSPPLPFQAPGFRPGTFDDHDGLELDEKDIRILVAQDAYADQERPSVLFDTTTLKGNEVTTRSPTSPAVSRHERTPSGITSSKSYFSPQADSSPSSALKTPGTAFQMRNRSSTVSGGLMGPTSPNLRDAESRDATNDILECMFGSASSTKTGTRMHIFKAGGKGPVLPTSPIISPTAWNSKPRRNPPLVRAHTSALPNLEAGRTGRDVVLITRIFTVAPPESVKDSSENISRITTAVPEENTEEISANASGQAKRPKLREKKTPSYGVSLVISLPPRVPSRPASRYMPRSEDAIHSIPASSSYGSDMQSSWTFLDALPPSLTSSQSIRSSVVDHNVNYLLRRWDTIVRHLSALEREAREKIFTLLGQVDETSNGPKTPKEKKMQRINQRIVRLPAHSLSDDKALASISLRAIQHVRSAVSIPPVKPLHGGHWLEEARLIARLCSEKGNDKFLAILMTAFLGTHFEWIDELSYGPHRKRVLLKKKSRLDQSSMRSRTVVICEDRSVARRLVFLLASFVFPGMHSLRSTGSDAQSLRNSRRDSTMHTTTNRVTAEISTSVSSMDEDSGGRLIPSRPRRRLERNMSETSSLRITANLSIPIQDASFRKSSAGTTTTVTPNPSTPLAYIASNSKEPDSYFAIDSSVGGSAATASLQRLRRSSSAASSGPSTWGSLLGSFWSNKQNSSASTNNMTFPFETVDSLRASRPVSESKPNARSKLEDMACEVGTDGPSSQSVRNLSDAYESTASPSLKAVERVDIPPRLQVDERDGVVDVDLNLPGGENSHGSSPFALPAFATPMSTSTTSLDGTASIYSVRSSLKTCPDPINNIAGYLKQYHPDFVLQAVKSYSEADLRASMSSEPDQDGTTPENGSNVCNTLIADTRTYSVKRLTLRRGTQGLKNCSTNTASASASTSHEQFILENVHSYDETLADAIERALDRPSAIPSRIPSPSPSKSRHYRNVSNSTTSTSKTTPPQASALSSSLTKDSLQPVHVPQRNRGQLILDALKEVVVDVDRDMHSSVNGQNISSTPTPGSTAIKNQNREENALREGVKRWLQEADEMNVW